MNSNLIIAEVIEINFLEPGHTFMSADSFHHQVELSMKHYNGNKLYDFNDFVHCVQNTNSKRVDVNLSADDFFDWKDYKSKSKTEKKFYLHDIQQIVANRGEKVLRVRKGYDKTSPLTVLDFLQKKVIKKGIPEPTKKVCCAGISSKQKKDTISKLVPLLPQNRRAFWLNLPVSNEATENGDSNDESEDE